MTGRGRDAGSNLQADWGNDDFSCWIVTSGGLLRMAPAATNESLMQR